MHKKRDAGQVRCGTERMQDRWDAGLKGWTQNRRKQKKRKAGKDGRRTGGSRKRGNQVRRDAEQEEAEQEEIRKGWTQ